jgi:hypothetical protein
MKAKTLNLKPGKRGNIYWVNRTRYNSITLYCPHPEEPQKVYLALSRVMNERKSRRFCPGGDVARYSGLTHDRVKIAYGELEKLGVITRDYVSVPGGIPNVLFITITGDVRYE